jgi:hypothetical protein
MRVNVFYKTFNGHVQRSTDIDVILKRLIFEFVAKAEICDFPHIISSKNVLRLEISVEDL